ncbi:MAG: aldehyde ferredoxin oxidoreductase [Candidatus Korarchaeota archaeon]|nr:aldehyde ferredoxin oxidoreductase [Candidatus Korarchaeota archaeon]
MGRGYAGKLLEVNLTEEASKPLHVALERRKTYLGGRGLATRILWDRLGEQWEHVDPLSKRNLLLILTGPLTGYYPGGRVCVSGKSPQSNGIVGSTVAGEFGVELKCAGYDGLVVTGKAERPTYLLIRDDQVTFKNATSLWGRGGKHTVLTITKQARTLFTETYPIYGTWKEPSILYIGPAGERKARIAPVMSKLTHAAGYGGYGAVMGSKNLKAVAVKGTDPLPDVEDWQKVRKIIQRISKECYANKRFRRWGTGAGGYNFAAESSSEPVKNWQEEWHDRKEFGVQGFEKLWVKRYWADFGCPVSCMKLGTVKNGVGVCHISDAPDYELQAYVGANLGVFSPEENMRLAALVDEYGICGIQGGNILGFTAELYQRGVLTEEDLGFTLEWGDPEGFTKLIEKIVKREGIGNVLAEGTYRAAKKISNMKGEDVMQYAVTSKGISIGAHGIRSGEDFISSPISYVCSTQGGDHTSGASLRNREDRSILTDSAVICNFVVFSNSSENIWQLLQAVTGWKIDAETWKQKALRILTLQRAALLLGGPDVSWLEQDENPPRFYDPLPTGPYTGRKVEKEEVHAKRSQYYRQVGWDERGIPTSQTLRELSLPTVDKKLGELRT